ncbi:MAG: hypothetical protein LBO73_04655 [Holosporaceae bacterium]|nr:hypothetical protein [Holosporaceae bacterium]
MIAERDGQKLRNFITDSVRDLGLAQKHYRLTIKPIYSEKPFAMSSDGNATRIMISYVADVTLRNEKGEVIFNRPISIFTGSNIANAQGEVILSMYGRNNSVLLKELSDRIIESVRMFLSDEN